MENNRILLGARLLCASGLVRDGAVLCDVGTDHGKLPIYLVQSDKIKKAYATDINQGPINTAKGNIARLGLSERIECLLTDGLEGTDGLGITDVCICGMGGELISRILSDCSYVRSPEISLVLQPMSHAEDLRKYLFDSGFVIDDERLVEDADKLYVVMKAHYCGNITKYEPYQLYLGNVLTVENSGELYIEMCRRVLYHLNNKQKSNDPVQCENAQRLYDVIKDMIG